MNRGAGVVAGAIVAVVLLPIALLIGVVTLSEGPAAACTASAGAGTTTSLTSLPAVDGYDAVQVTNAAQIVNAAALTGLSVARRRPV